MFSNLKFCASAILFAKQCKTFYQNDIHNYYRKTSIINNAEEGRRKMHFRLNAFIMNQLYKPTIKDQY